MKNFLKQWVPSIVIGVVISLFIRSYVAEAMEVPTGSMIPTIQINDRLVVEKLWWRTGLKFGDIVVFNAPESEGADKRFVKRLIGLPGDIIEIKDSALYRNNEIVSENYINEAMRYDYGPIKVPEDHYFFLGDNRNNSNDSHQWPSPFIAYDELIGKVIWIVPVHVLTD